MLLTEIIPQVESDYKVSKNREDRAIAGLSMGGREAITIGLNSPRKFAWIGSFSGAFPAGLPLFERDLVAAIGPERTDLRLLWIACGASDPYVKEGNRRLSAQLEQDGLTVTKVVTEGGHDWPVWHDNLRQFLPLLFQPK
jgi:enterochelin esterase family protein